jgi:hypothetical protein
MTKSLITGLGFLLFPPPLIPQANKHGKGEKRDAPIENY